MEWKDVGNVIKKAAPILGTAIGGPYGAAAGGVISLICGALGIEDDSPDPEKVMQQIQADPEALVKLREIELGHKTELERILLERDRIHIADVADARRREVETTKSTGKRDINLYILAWLVVAGFFILIGILIWATMPQSNIGPVNQLFGALAAGFGMVLQYFFGSSRGSAEKTSLLAGLSKK